MITYCLTICSLCVAQQTIELATLRAEPGVSETLPTRDIEIVSDGIVVTYNFHHAVIHKDPLFKNSSFVKIDGFGLNHTEGQPSTLFRWDTFVLPNSNYKITVLDSSYVDIPLDIAPARPPLFLKHYMYKIKPIKSYSEWYPQQIISEAKENSYHSQVLLDVCINPISYNYNIKVLRLFKKITYKIITEDNICQTKKNSIKSFSASDVFLKNTTVNWSVSSTKNSTLNSISEDCTSDYAIITIPQYLDSIREFVNWKRYMGYNVHVLSQDVWTPSLIKSQLKQIYDDNSTNLEYILIVGDHDDVPCEQKALYVTDYYYAFKNGRTTGEPDFMCGRLSVSTADEAATVTNKIINYEKNPPSDEDFYSTGLHCAYFQDEMIFWNPNDPYIDGRAERRFAQTSEEIRDVLCGKGYTVTRLYSALSNSNPKYWNLGVYSTGAEIPQELQRPIFNWNASHHDIINGFNNGAFYVLHNDHGAPWRWSEPPFLKEHIQDLTNGNKLPVIFDLSCETGMINDTVTCFAEAFLRKESGGCIAIYAATYDTYSGYSDALLCGMFDAIWPDNNLIPQFPNSNFTYSNPPIPTYRLGQIKQQGLKRMRETWGNSVLMHEVFHCFGDPSMMIYTGTPTTFMNVIVNRSSDEIRIDTGEENAVISFVNLVTGQVSAYYGDTAIYTGETDKVAVCVSAHNKIPYIDSPSIEFIQNEVFSQNKTFSADNIMVGSNVTISKPNGAVIVNGGKLKLIGNSIQFDGETIINAGAELEINNP